MLHIFLVILKIIAIALLVILGLLILCVLSFLFVPIRYKINITAFGKGEQTGIRGDGRFSYLGPLLRARINYRGDFYWEIKLLGLILKCSEDIEKDVDEDDFSFGDYDNKSYDSEVLDLSENEEMYLTKDSEDTVSSEETREKFRKDSERDSENIFEDGIDKENSSEEDSNSQRAHRNTPHFGAETRFRIKTFIYKIKLLFVKIKQLFFRIKKGIKNIEGTFKNIGKFYNEVTKLITDVKFKSSFKAIFGKCFLVIKKFLPVIKKAEFRFGTKDPALSGKILGAVSVFNGLSRQMIVLQPDFEAERLFVEGEAILKGKIRMWYIAKLIWYYLFSEEVKYFKHKIEVFRRKL